MAETLHPTTAGAKIRLLMTKALSTEGVGRYADTVSRFIVQDHPRLRRPIRHILQVVGSAGYYNFPRVMEETVILAHHREIPASRRMATAIAKDLAEDALPVVILGVTSLINPFLGLVLGTLTKTGLNYARNSSRLQQEATRLHAA